MSMLDSFFNKGFKAIKCKTLLKLTIPRIKLLRNRREIQLKQMRRDIAKLLETGQEATARIRVEHIIREENMMAAQEILELFCELITVRLPIIETQRECPIDLKEAISSVCFAAPRCADLTELLQVQLLFAAKYGKEFVSAATELRPDCGVNRQLIELLSVRAPSPEKKMKLLKEIAEEHDLDWDPAGSEAEFNKSHDDLLNGSTQFVSATKVPLPNEKHDETHNATPDLTTAQQHDSDYVLEMLAFPEVPKVSVSPHPTVDTGVASSPTPPPFVPPHPESDRDSLRYSGLPEIPPQESHFRHEDVAMGRTVYSGISEIPPQESHFRHEDVALGRTVSSDDDQMNVSVGEDKQFVPFITSPSLSSSSFTARQSDLPPSSVSRTSSFTARQSDLPPPSVSRTRSEVNVNLEDVLAAAQEAAETAERAAAAARSAASLAKIRIDELTKKKNDQDPGFSCENPFHGKTASPPGHNETPQLNQQDSLGHSSSMPHYSSDSFQDHKVSHDSDVSNHHQPEPQKSSFESSLGNAPSDEHKSVPHQPQRLPSMDDDPCFSYPNLFTSQKSNPSFDHSPTDRSPTGGS